MGDYVSVDYPHGYTLFTVPDRNLLSQKLRLKKLVLHDSDYQGEWFVTLKLNLPESWSNDELRLLERLRSVRKAQPGTHYFDHAGT